MIDSSASTTTTVADAFRKCSHTIDIAHDGEEGLDRARSRIYDLIILEVDLPKLGGLDILRCLRDERNFVHVIFLSSRAETSERVAGLDAGADDYLAKPFDVGELIARGKALLRL